MARTRTGTCDGCGKRRKLTYPEDRTRELFEDPKTGMRLRLTREEREERENFLIHYYGLCSECFPLVKTKDDITKLRKERPKKERGSRLAYPCVGGPLNGEYAIATDFQSERGKPGDSWYQEAGMYAHLEGEYKEYNSAFGASKRIGKGFPSMIFVHTSMLKPLARSSER